MKLSWHWLGMHLDLAGLSAKELSGRFTMSVAELDGVEEVGAGTDKVVVGRIVESAAHPQADKLAVLKVDVGEAAPRTLVSGAPNVKVGLLVPVALPGAVLPAGPVEARDFRGVFSDGVGCSERDLGLSDDHSGLLELPTDTRPGTPMQDLVPLHDFIWELDNKSITHRPDLWNHRGIAREIAALAGRSLKPLPLADLSSSGPAIPVKVDDPSVCPRYFAVGFGGIVPGPAPLWMRTLLYRVGTRPISNVVDLTNFVMMDVGNPLHAFDRRRISGPIRVRNANPGETMKTLDGQDRALLPNDLLITDDNGGIALAGVMGGADSEIAGDTTQIILESACFRAATIRKTSARLGLRSDSSMRFEKALDQTLPQTAARRFAVLLGQLCPSAHQNTAFTDVAAPLPAPTVIAITGQFVNRKLGTALTVQRMAEILRALAFEVALDGDAMQVTVPVFRATRDISIPEDLVEEIGRVVGYDNITPVPPLAAVEPPIRPLPRLLERHLRHFLARDCAAQEVMLYSFDSLAWCKTIGHSLEGSLRLRNCISADMPTMRRSLMPNLLAAGQRNQSNYDDQRFFETGRVFFAPQPGDEIPPQERHLGFLALEKRGDAASLFRRTRGTLEALLESLKRGTFTLTPAAPLANEPWTVAGRLLEVKHQSGAVLGRLGQVNPFLMSEGKLRGVGVFFELNTDPLLAIPEGRGRWKPSPRFPRISYDLSFVLAKAVPYGDVAQTVSQAAGEFLTELELVAVYEGKPIPADSRSLSFRLVFGDDNRTLRDDEVRPAVEAVVEAVKQRCGGTLRDA